jgi:hypothetical protein
MRDLSDPISRQQTITALRALSDDDGYINVPHEVVTDVVRGLPPVQAEHEQTTQPEQGESDKLAPKIGKTWVDVTCPNCGCEIHVESEIIKCRDCKYTDGCEPIEDGRYWCCLHGSFMYYCSDAERREDE